MSHPSLAPTWCTLRLVTLFLFSICILLVVFGLPDTSRAKRQTAAQVVQTGKRSRPEFAPGQVLVKFRSESIAKTKSRETKLQSLEGKALPIQIERFTGSEIVPGLRLVKVPQTDTVAAIAALQTQPEVLYAEPNYRMYPDLTPNDPQFSSPNLYGLTKIAAPQAWDTNTGSASVVIGIVDEGVDVNHPDLTANKWVNPMPGSVPGITGDLNGYDFANNSGTIPAEEHATHVAGIAGARGNNGVGIVGVNWVVSIMSLKVLPGFTSDIVAAYSYAKQMRDFWVSTGGTKGANIRVLNNSYGGGSFSQTSFDAISALNQAGILFVGSAGNTDDGNSDNDLTPHYPSDYNLPNVISVAATNNNDLVTSFSHVGANSVHLGAPGQSILSTLPPPDADGYGLFSGTSMAAPHVTGSAALLWAQNPNLTVHQVKSLLLYNGDVIPDLVGQTITGRRLNIAKSFTALAENDVTAPGTVTNLHVNTQTGRNLNVGWNASGDDGANGQASLYELDFVDTATGAVIPLKKIVPASSGSAQSIDVKIPFRHTRGSVRVREFDNVGNEGTPATLAVTVPFADGDPYATTLGFAVALSTGGTGMGFNCDDCFKTDALPFNFTYFGQTVTSIKISSNGNIYFEPPTAPTRPGGDADDVPSLISELNRFRMISGLWDDIDLRTSSRAGADVYKVQPDSTRVIYRWEGVPCNFDPENNVCNGGPPINFEIELRNDGTIKSRYGSGNTAIFPVVGISGGEPEAYVITTHTSEFTPTNLTNAREVTYIPRSVTNPYDNNFFFISQQYRDLLNREPDFGGLDFWTSDLNACGSDQTCLIRRRVGISAAFFIELEFQRTGYFVYRSFKGALGRKPSYSEFTADRPQIVEGPNLEQTKQAYMLAFVQRAEFTTKYVGATTAAAFVDALIATIQTSSGVNLNSMKQALIDKYNTGGNMNQSRAFATRDAIDAAAFQSAEFNPAFVLMQYYGYLRRDIDQAGYDFWLSILNNVVPGNFQSMVCAFITSAEYQRRFSSLTPHSNAECGPPAFP